jgi:Fe-S cluster biogenesis protein NfuA
VLVVMDWETPPVEFDASEVYLVREGGCKGCYNN